MGAGLKRAAAAARATRRPGTTDYSRDVPGERCNYGWPVRFDMTDNCLGITQFENGKVKDRVLLSPKQVCELLAFTRNEQ